MAATFPTRLSAELEVYESQKSEWLREHRDQFVVIKGEKVLGFFSDFHQAYVAGVKKHGLEVDFLVKRVVAQEPVFVVF